MPTDALNILLGFLEGFTLILSPCILSVLPIMLASGLANPSRLHSLGLGIGFVTFFALVAFFSREVIDYFDIDLNILRSIAFILLALLGIILLSQRLTEYFNRGLQRLILGCNINLPGTHHQGFWKGLYTGGLLALVWTPCAGPILAAVILQIVIQQSNLNTFLTLMAFALGIVVPVLCLVTLTRLALVQFQFFKKYATQVHQFLGLMILVSVAYMFWQDQFTETVVATTPKTIKTSSEFQNKLWRPYPAPAISGAEDGLLELTADQPGLEVYTFTFE